jgi:two-component system, NarL family, response regulator NreC
VLDTRAALGAPRLSLRKTRIGGPQPRRYGQHMPDDDTAITSGSVRIVLADDHSVVRTGLRLLLDAEQDLQVVAEAGNASDAIRYVRGHHPDVLVLDLNMPGESGLDLIPRVRDELPDTKIVVLTMQRDPGFARQAISSGALGYVIKDAADGELVQAVRLAAKGQLYLNPQLGARLAAIPPNARPGDLTEREEEILSLIALGYTNSEIASQLYLSVRTIEAHRSHIHQKLSLATRSELVRFALEHRLIDVPDPNV